MASEHNSLRYFHIISFYNFVFIVFTLLFIQGGSRSLKILVSWGIKFVIILRIVSLKIEICLLTPLLEEALSQLNWNTDRWIRSLFAS